MPARSKTWVIAALYSLLLASLCFWKMRVDGRSALGVLQTAAVFLVILAATYFISSRDPIRHWPALLTGGTAHAYLAIAPWLPATSGIVSTRTAFFLALGASALAFFTFQALHQSVTFQNKLEDRVRVSALYLSEELLKNTFASDGRSLFHVLQDTPVLLAFLRHSGCCFCPESLSDLGHAREEIEAEGVEIVVVHFSRAGKVGEYMRRYGLSGITTVYDRDHRLARAFGVRQGTLLGLFGPQNWIRAVSTLLRGFLPGKVDGNPYLLAGHFLVQGRTAYQGFYQHNVSDRADFRKISQDGLSFMKDS